MANTEAAASVPAARAKHIPAVLVDPKTGQAAFSFFPRRIDGGLIVSAVGAVPLSFSRKHLACIPAGGNENWLITAEGFRAANAFAGVNVVFPPRVMIPGLGEVANPYIESDERGGFVKGWARAVGIYRNAMGEICIVDKPTALSLEAYLEEDLAAKAETNPSAVVWGSRDVHPALAMEAALKVEAENLKARAEAWEKKNPNKGPSYMRDRIKDGDAAKAETDRAREGVSRGLWRFFPVLGDEVGLWADLSAEPVRRVLRNLVQKRKFGERLLVSIAERNVLRAAFGVYNLDPKRMRFTRDKDGGVLEAEFTALIPMHRTEWDERTVQRLLADYMSGVRTAQLAGAIVDSSAVRQETGDPDLRGTMEEGAEERRFQGTEEAGRKAEPEARPSGLSSLFLEIRNAEEAAGTQTVDKARETVFGTMLVTLQNEPEAKLRAYLAALEPSRPKREGGTRKATPRPDPIPADPTDADMSLGGEGNPNDVPF